MKGKVFRQQKKAKRLKIKNQLDKMEGKKHFLRNQGSRKYSTPMSVSNPKKDIRKWMNG